MACVIGIMGDSGHGKTTAARTLDPKKTFYIDADGKGLSFKGWNKNYSFENKNYVRTIDFKQSKENCGADFRIQKTMQVLKKISDEQSHIEVVIIDTANGLMIDYEMETIKIKSYDKWNDLASSVYCMIRDSHLLRPDLFVIFMFHVQIESDDNGNKTAGILTNGRKLNKIKLETKLTNLLYAKCVDGRYFFETQANSSTAKSMMGLFDTLEIDNDLKLVIDSIKTYENGE